MKLLVDIDLLDDEALQASIATGSLWLALVGTLLGVFGGVALPPEQLGPAWFVALGAVSMLALPVHELVHAAAFKLLSGGRASITFGFASWMLYTAAPGCLLPRLRFRLVLLAPAVVVTLALAAGACAAGMPLLGWFLAVIHLAGCTGDAAYARVIASESNASHVMDTDRGIALYDDNK